MTESSPVARVSVVTTGSGAAHPEHLFGTRKPDLWWIFRSKEWIDVVLNVFVIEHERGLVLFDTGVSPRITDPDFWPDRVTKLFMDHIFRWDVGPDDDLATQLAESGFAAGDVVAAVLSHLHADHAGGINAIPQADLYVAPEAWEHMHGPHPEREMVLRRDLDIPDARWRQLLFGPTSDPALAAFGEACDLFDDGSLIVLPTPGHLAGSVSLLIRRNDAPPVLLIGDLTYSEDLLNQDIVAGTGEADVLRESYAKVRELKRAMPDLAVIAGHDPGAEARLAGDPDVASLSRDAIWREPRYDVTDETVIAAKPEAVWEAIVAEHNGLTRWWAPELTAEPRVGPSYDQIGAIVDNTVMVRGRVPLRSVTMTTRVDPGREIRVEYVDGALRGEGIWQFVPEGDGTRLRYVWRTNPAGPLRLLAPVLPVAHAHRSTMEACFAGLQRHMAQTIDLTEAVRPASLLEDGAATQRADLMGS